MKKAKNDMLSRSLVIYTAPVLEPDYNTKKTGLVVHKVLEKLKYHKQKTEAHQFFKSDAFFSNKGSNFDMTFKCNVFLIRTN